ncbi:MAG: polyprenyl synthetase family protein [Micrococcaceae bacterium]
MKTLPAAFGIDHLDPQLTQEILEAMQEVEKRLDTYLTQKDLFTSTMSKHLMLAGGKRIRPFLTLLSAQFGPEGINSKVIDAAVVTELTHLATLYHDDVMDNADLRRGTATAHALWGNNAAILTGDLLLAKASLIISALGGEALGIQAQTFERLCLGQLHESVAPPSDEDPYEYHLQVILDKTGSLIATAGEYGAMFAGANRKTRGILRAYGEKVGTAFQLVDDIIDVTSDSDQSGKVRGTDLKEGIPTLPVLLLEKKGNPAELKVIKAAENGTDEQVQAAIALLSESEETQQAWNIARKYAQEAKDLLDPLPDNSAKKALQDFAMAMVERDK